jgi:hypothetical protein
MARRSAALRVARSSIRSVANVSVTRRVGRQPGDASRSTPITGHPRTGGAAGHRVRVHRVRHALSRRATLPGLPTVLQTCRSRWAVPSLRGAGRRRRSHRMTREVRSGSAQNCPFPQRRGSPAPPPQESYYGGVSLSSPEVTLTGRPHLSIKLGPSALSKPHAWHR